MGDLFLRGLPPMSTSKPSVDPRWSRGALPDRFGGWLWGVAPSREEEVAAALAAARAEQAALAGPTQFLPQVVSTIPALPVDRVSAPMSAAQPGPISIPQNSIPDFASLAIQEGISPEVVQQVIQSRGKAQSSAPPQAASASAPPQAQSPMQQPQMQQGMEEPQVTNQHKLAMYGTLAGMGLGLLAAALGGKGKKGVRTEKAGLVQNRDYRPGLAELAGPILQMGGQSIGQEQDIQEKMDFERERRDMLLQAKILQLQTERDIADQKSTVDMASAMPMVARAGWMVQQGIMDPKDYDTFMQATLNPPMNEYQRATLQERGWWHGILADSISRNATSREKAVEITRMSVLDRVNKGEKLTRGMIEAYLTSLPVNAKTQEPSSQAMLAAAATIRLDPDIQSMYMNPDGTPTPFFRTARQRVYSKLDGASLYAIRSRMNAIAPNGPYGLSAEAKQEWDALAEKMTPLVDDIYKTSTLEQESGGEEEGSDAWGANPYGFDLYGE
jgi:hypothetical protein